mgnify:FL=1
MGDSRMVVGVTSTPSTAVGWSPINDWIDRHGTRDTGQRGTGCRRRDAAGGDVPAVHHVSSEGDTVKGPLGLYSLSQWPEIIQERARMRREAPPPHPIGSDNGLGIGQGTGVPGRRWLGTEMVMDDARYVDAGHWKRSVC